MTAETIPRPTAIFQPLRGILKGLELPGDALLFIYFAVLARQYLWWCTDKNGPAWIAAALVAAIIALLYLSSKETSAYPEKEGAQLPFWLVAVLPLVFVYLMRVVFPDVSFDVLNYRLLHSERALRGFLYLPGEFFPTPAPYNPAPDMVTGLFRHALGYRLGTIVNLLAMIWVARVADKLLRPFLLNAWVRATGVLLVVMAEHLLFEINNYMADLLALPLLLEATYLALQHVKFKNEQRNFVRIAFLLGVSVAFKLTNAGVAAPIVLLCAYRALSGRRTDNAKKSRQAKELGLTALVCAVVFLLPLLPFSAYLYRETGSPAFPVFNGIFKSGYWPANNVWDPRWGPAGLWEKLAWPILITFKPERLSELNVYSGRISLGFVAAIAGLVFVRRNARLRELCLLVALASLLWSCSTGYIRYALYIEIMGAIVVLALASELASQNSSPGRRSATTVLIACLLWLGLAWQSCVAGYYVSKMEWAQRPTIFSQPAAYRKEANYLLRDRTLKKFLDNDARDKLDQVEVWIVSSIKTSGVENMMQPDAPMIGVNTGEYFATADGRQKFDKVVERISGKRIFSLAFNEDLEAAKATLLSRGFQPIEIVPVEIPFYSQHARIKASLIKVAAVSKEERAAMKNGEAAAGTALPDSAYRAEIFAAIEPKIMKAGAKEVIHLKVRNAGTDVWPSHVPRGWKYVVTVGDRWLSADGKVVVNDMDSRTALQDDLNPGDEAELVMVITAPPTAGQYVLELDMVHEGVTWFYQRGSPTLRWSVQVEE